MPGNSNLSLLREVPGMAPGLPVILIAESSGLTVWSRGRYREVELAHLQCSGAGSASLFGDTLAALSDQNHFHRFLKTSRRYSIEINSTAGILRLPVANMLTCS